MGPGPLGDVLARIAGRVPTADEQAGRVEQWIVLIRERVDDDGLRAAPCVRIATAICEGRFPDRELYRLLSALDERRRGGRLQGQGAAWKYFVGASQKRFIELGIPW